MRHLLLTISAVILSTFCTFLPPGCSPKPRGGNVSVSGDTVAPRDVTDSLLRISDSIAAGLGDTLLAARLVMPAIYAQNDPYTLQAARRYAERGVGGVVLLKGTSAGAKAIADTLARYSAAAPFVAIDAEWGLGMRLADEPRYASSAEIGSKASEEQMFDYGFSLAAECRRLGINMVLGPVADVADSLGVMRRRSYGSDPHRVADLAVAYAHGLVSGGVVSVAKHFPGHGAARGDSHRVKPMLQRSLHELDSLDLYPFRRYIAHGLPAIMVGHMAVPSVDPELRPAAVSSPVISDLLRDDLGFRGLVLTDALNMEGAQGFTAADAIRAGADIVIAPADTQRAIDSILAALADGSLTRTSLRRHAAKAIFTLLLHQ